MINSSPRKDFNTARLCERFTEGVRAVNENVRINWINLYELKFTGCQSCFACKKKGSTFYGKCAVRDDLKDVLQQIEDCDGLVIGTPIYLASVPGYLKCMLERLLFAKTTYESGYRSLFGRKLPVQMIYSMNATPEQAEEGGFLTNIAVTEDFIAHVLGTPQHLIAYNTYQFKDYSLYDVEVFSETEKAAYRHYQFPKDLQAAYEAGKGMAEKLFA